MLINKNDIVVLSKVFWFIGLKIKKIIWLLSIFLFFFPPASLAQTTCTNPDYSVSTPLTDLGSSEYYRLTSIDPLTYAPTGIIGGLYPGGSNARPPVHETNGVTIAQSIEPLDSAGLPDPNGKIGMVSLGMSNTQMDFQEFMAEAGLDPTLNPKLVLANGAMGGAIIEAWVDPNYAGSPNYQTVWQNFDAHITSAGLTPAQVQVVWVKVTQLQYKANFPADMQDLSNMYVTLAQLLKTRLPNLKITYFSSRTRSYNYFTGLAPESTAFENGFAVRWLIENQLNGDPALNYLPENGPVMSSYLSWGPYLWINGNSPRLDGRIWPASYLAGNGDCTHPSAEGLTAVAGMMLDFYKSDTTTRPWFLSSSLSTPTPSPSPVSSPIPGDANGDGVVDFEDLRIWFANYGQGGGIGQGNFNTDIKVNLLDFGVWLVNYTARK